MLQNRKQIEYTIGEKVRVYFPIAENEDLRYKLGVRWRGPYTIVNKIDNVTYRVKKDEYNRMMTMPVHVHRLKKCLEK